VHLHPWPEVSLLIYVILFVDEISVERILILSRANFSSINGPSDVGHTTRSIFVHFNP
jgi:hypothetical protein